jgi:predicted RecA/RadA family phage recombinase
MGTSSTEENGILMSAIVIVGSLVCVLIANYAMGQAFLLLISGVERLVKFFKSRK